MRVLLVVPEFHEFGGDLGLYNEGGSFVLGWGLLDIFEDIVELVTFDGTRDLFAIDRGVSLIFLRR